MNLKMIGLGGGCHWCTEAYFQSLKGVQRVDQGWISSTFPNDTFSEAVIVHYDASVISLKVLLSIHLHTHSATKRHSLREKYRSAVYAFDDQTIELEKIISECQVDFDEQIITQVLLFKHFKATTESYTDYYQHHKGGLFCKRYIDPKLRMIENEYPEFYREI